MSNIYLPANMGDAVFIGGKPYHRTGTAPEIVENGTEMTKPKETDFTGVVGYTWYFDDSRIQGGPDHRVWTACEMAACYLNGHKDKSKPNPMYLSESDFKTSMPQGARITTTDVAFSGSGGRKCTGTVTRETWTAPGSGIVRVFVSSVNDNSYVAWDDGSGNFYRAFIGGTLKDTAGNVVFEYGLLINGIAVSVGWSNNREFYRSAAARVNAGDSVSFGRESDIITAGLDKTGISGSIENEIFIKWNGVFLPEEY